MKQQNKLFKKVLQRATRRTSQYISKLRCFINKKLGSEADSNFLLILLCQDSKTISSHESCFTIDSPCFVENCNY